MRYAIYYTPERSQILSRIAASWLGRDPYADAPVEAASTSILSPAEIAFHTASARRYGFHATLKAPFTLAEGETEAELDAALAAYAEVVAPVVIRRLVAAQMDGFIALVPADKNPELHRLADDVVRIFDRFRAPLTDAEIERRNPDALSPAEFHNLCHWGYPYVFETFRFHMTLTGRLAKDESATVAKAVDEMFGAVLSQPVVVGGLSLFVETEPGAPFKVRSYHPLGEISDRKMA